MYAEERQRTIVTLAMRYDRVAVTDLSKRFQVTETIRRDLEMLDRRGILRRVHGGAVPAENVRLVETAVTDREPAFAAQKSRIAQAALQFVPTGSGSTVLIDSGTTTARLASAMSAGQVPVVVTNSVSIASQLALVPGGGVHLLGGRVRGLTQATVGGETVDALGRLNCDVVFLGTNGVSVSHGLSTPDPDEAAVKRAMVRAARRVVLLADSSKVGANLLVSFATLNEVHVLVTDSGLQEADREQLVSAGLEVVVA
jgi:DeoR family fructose operon transcriptional repressor